MMNISTDLYDILLQKLDIRAIAAMAANGVIGNNNSIPWNIPEEMAFFRKMTQNASVLMGRKTFESIGHPLPNRRNIVMTKDSTWHPNTAITIQKLDQLLELDIKGPLWVCGGAMIYEMLFPACRELYLSTVFGKFDGDTKMPPFGDTFVIDKTILTCPTFKVDHYVTRRHANIEKRPIPL
ncbi:MAG: dihydrofolate reductase [Puniceicoccales bacterium]|jgi:dihydrofolate reductase|nr:dihydrofolate reductase [Puniceicoccales bacterium]